MRKDVCSSLTYLGVKLDEEKNNVRGEERTSLLTTPRFRSPGSDQRRAGYRRETLALVK